MKNILSKEKIRHLGIGPWGNIDKNTAENCRFGFFGEFGYGIICWAPYVKYLSEQGIKIKALVPSGLEPIWNFSDDIVSVAAPTQDCLGMPSAIREAKKLSSYSSGVIAPTEKRRSSLFIAGKQWKNRELFQNFSGKNYSLLTPEKSHPKIKYDYAVINIKNYFNWGLTGIPNFYSSKEVEIIANICKSKGLKLVINRFLAPEENSNIYAHESKKWKDILGHDNVIDMAPIYASATELGEKNKIQFGLLSGAKHVFASQGGNAAISIILSKSVSILMRGGFDYPAYKSLGRLYSVDIDLCFEIDQFKNCKSNKYLF